MVNGNTGKSALVLSGGGAYGAYEIGVVRALVEGKSRATGTLPLDPHVFVGTSVGGFNAAMLAANKGGTRESIAELERVWRDEIADKGDGRGNGVYRVRGNPMGYLDPRIPGSPMESVQRLFADTTALGENILPRMLHLFDLNAGLVNRFESLIDIAAVLNIDPFCHLIQKSLVPHLVRTSHKVLRVMATDWQSGDAHEFDFRHLADQDIWDAVRASAAIPGLFPGVTIWGKKFIDGGVVQNTPIRPAIEEGADEIHVVSLNAKLSQFPQSRLENTVEIFTRVYSAMLSALIDEDIETARWINDGLEVMQRAEEGHMHAEKFASFARVASVIYRHLNAENRLPRTITIHRYFPDKCLGDMLGMLNFHTDAIGRLIDDGYADATAHNCDANGCVVPQKAVRTLTVGAI